LRIVAVEITQHPHLQPSAGRRQSSARHSMSSFQLAAHPFHGLCDTHLAGEAVKAKPPDSTDGPLNAAVRRTGIDLYHASVLRADHDAAAASAGQADRIRLLVFPFPAFLQRSVSRSALTGITLCSCRRMCSLIPEEVSPCRSQP